MSSGVRALGTVKGRLVRAAGSAAAAALRRRAPSPMDPGVTVVTVTWNSLPFLRGMVAATRACSPPDTRLLVVDNGSADGTAEHLRTTSGVEVMRLPINVGHGIALDLAMSRVTTELVAVLDVDAFPVSPRWIDACREALAEGAQVVGAHLHRNFVHPSFLVARTATIRDLGLTFRPVGSLARLHRSAPLFLDVGEALSQRVVVKFGGGQALHFFEITSLRGPGNAGAVFGDLVYHNQFATQGAQRSGALGMFQEALAFHHPALVTG